VFKMKQILLATLIATVAVACGGGSGMSQSSGMTPLIATGTITGFGSIYVNGIHFQTASATIRKNGQTVDQSQLAVGEVARIKGSKNDADNTGVAEEVDVEEAVVGAIDKIDTTGGTLTVLAQIVKINAGTSFSKDIQPADITGLKTGDVIHVSGMTDSSGDIVATRIEKGSASSPLQVVGTVASLNAGSHTFMINALTVDYSSANLTGFMSGAPSNGDVVEVQGTTYDMATQKLTATHVQREMTDEEEAGDNRDMEREGLITRFASATDFDVDGKPVTTTTSTEYRNGTAAGLALNVKVEVEGMLNSSNVLVASIVSFEHNGDIELQGPAANVMATAGTLTVLGVQVTVNSSTRLEDEGSSSMAMFNLSNVTAGDTVRVRGFESPAGSGKVVATRLERQPTSMTVIVKGPFMAGTSPDFTVLGITIDGSAATIDDGHGGMMPLAMFLTQAVGHEVFVEGTLSGTTVMASRISIDDHHGDEN
jgi:Domain of unknown function (DUF5666)